MEATAIICKRCGTTIEVIENTGKLVCQSCGTEYILNNESGEKILTEFHFDNPFTGLQRIIDENLIEIQSRMEAYNDYKSIHNELVQVEDDNTYKYGYWILRLRSFTHDFKQNFNNFIPFIEVFDCIINHLTFSEFTKEENKCITEYFERNIPILQAKIDSLKAGNLSAEESIIKLLPEKNKLSQKEIALKELIATPQAIEQNTRKENPKIYVWYYIIIIACAISIAISHISIILSFIFLITLVGIALFAIFYAVSCIFSIIGISLGITIYILARICEGLEIKYKNRIKSQIDQIRKRIQDIDKNITQCKEICIKTFYEWKNNLRIINLINKFYSNPMDLVPSTVEETD